SVTLAANLVSVTATVTDNDGDQQSAHFDLGPQITIYDDGPALGSLPPGQLPNESNAQATGHFDIAPGADGLHDLQITWIDTNGNHYTSVYDSLNGCAELNTPAFTLDVYADGHYTFELIDATAATYENVPIGSFGDVPNGANDKISNIVLFGADDQSIGIYADIHGTGGNNKVQIHNESEIGMAGGGGNGLDKGNTITIDFHSDPNASGGPHAVELGGITLSLSQGNFQGTYTWLTNTGDSGTFVVGQDGTVHVYDQNMQELPGSGGTVSGFLIDPANPFSDITLGNDLVSSGPSFKLGGVSIMQTILPHDATLDFSITATDGDGDTSTSPLGIHIVASDSDGNFLFTATHDADVMVGSYAHDTFQFNSVSDSPNNRSLHDVIQQFDVSLDKLDFSNISGITNVVVKEVSSLHDVHPSSSTVDVGTIVIYQALGGTSAMVLANDGTHGVDATHADMMVLLTGIQHGMLTEANINLHA
ncbi:MAG: hypothetical protein FWD68_13035, partial [Alphaproteobacteria bacterium]|nr:hypothetical protein [Alphaproteobacteria bacterium]